MTKLFLLVAATASLLVAQPSQAGTYCYPVAGTIECYEDNGRLTSVGYTNSTGTTYYDTDASDCD